MKSGISTCLLIACLLVLSPIAYGWTPDQFSIVCAKEIPIKVPLSSDPDLNSGITTTIEKVVADDCMSASKKQQIEGYATEALRQWKSYKFKSPSPGHLGPVIQSEKKGKAVKIYGLVDSGEDLAKTTSNCLKSNKIVDLFSQLHIGVNKYNKLPPQYLFRYTAHEIAHVVENAQAFQKESKACYEIPGWLYEGIADALSADLTQTRFNHYPRLNSESRMLYGLRPYHKNFVRTGSRKLVSTALNGYRTSSFWRYLKEKYYGNRFDFLSVYLNIPNHQITSNGWISWLDLLLQTDAPGPKKPLYLVYPDFVANYANWGKDKFKKVGDKAWLSEGFGGCHQLSLSPKQAKRSLSLKVEPISAQCIKIAVGGVKPGETFSVKFMAKHADMKMLDQIHLSTAYIDTTVASTKKKFNCYKDANTKKSTCVNKPFTGKMPGQNPQMKSRTWLSEPLIADSQNVDSQYMVSFVPINPTDNKHVNNSKTTIQLTVALDHTSLTTSTIGKAKKATTQAGLSGQVGSTNLNALSTIPMSGSLGVANVMSLEGLLANTESLSLLPFGMNIPDVTEGLRGLHIVTFDDLVEKDDSDGESEFVSKIRVMLAFEEPIQPGSTGSFKGSVFGMLNPDLEDTNPNNMLVNIGDEPSGIVEIIEYSTDLLHMKASGTYCRIYNMSEAGVCQQVESFQAEVVKPFGLAYGTAGFNSVDTPGMKLYRGELAAKVVTKLMDETRNAPEPDTDEAEASPPSQAQSCSCSCQEYQQLTQSIDGISESPPEDPMQMMKCMMPCMMQYAQCEE